MREYQWKSQLEHFLQIVWKVAHVHVPSVQQYNLGLSYVPEQITIVGSAVHVAM